MRLLTITVEVDVATPGELFEPYVDMALTRYVNQLRKGYIGCKTNEAFMLNTNRGNQVIVRSEA